MDFGRFSKKELVNILEIINQATRCKDSEGVKSLLGRLKDLVCGDYTICGIGKGDKEGLHGPPMIINGNYPEEWLNIYGGQGLFYSDPLILHNFNNPGAQIWEETYSLYNDKLLPVHLEAREFGLWHGISGGLYNENSKMTSLFSFSGRGKWFGKHQQEILSIVGPHIHQALIRAFKSAQAPSVQNLSAREKEIAKWMKAGKTNWEISAILNISERTVKFHIQNIERKLDAVNKAHAVAILMEQESAD